MRGVPHALAGAAVVAPLALVAGSDSLIPLVLAGALGGLLPDIDHPRSTLGRWFFFWPGFEVAPGRCGRWWFTGRIWHRDQVHSFGMAILFTLMSVGAVAWLAPHLLGPIAFSLIGKGVAPLSLTWLGFLGGAVFLGFSSHLLLDTLNPSPQMLLWPFSHRHLRPNFLPGLSSKGLLLRGAELGVSLLAIYVLYNVFQHLPT